MRRGSLAGIGALAFGILPLVTFAVTNPPGGGYSAADAVDYVAKGHRLAVFVGMYLFLAAGIGLALLLARLQAAIDGERGRLFTMLGTGAVATLLGGFALMGGVAMEYAFGGGSKIDLSPSVVYTFSQVGLAMMFGAAGPLLGAALVTFACGRVAAPAWVRWSTAVAGVAALAAVAWFPFFLVYAWAIAVGVWLLVADRGRVPMTAPQAV
jgi:hypothetical protein